MTEVKRLALVTGASGGIGLELAKQFVLHDYDLVVCAEEEAIHQAADALGVSGAVITPVQVDLRTYDSVESLYTAVKGTVDRWMLLRLTPVSGWAVRSWRTT